MFPPSAAAHCLGLINLIWPAVSFLPTTVLVKMLVVHCCSTHTSHEHGPQLLHQLHASGRGMQHKPHPELPPTGCAGVGPLITAVRMMLSHLNDARETLLLLLALGLLQELMQTQSGKVRLPRCRGLLCQAVVES